MHIVTMKRNVCVMNVLSFDLSVITNNQFACCVTHHYRHKNPRIERHQRQQYQQSIDIFKQCHKCPSHVFEPWRTHSRRWRQRRKMVLCRDKSVLFVRGRTLFHHLSLSLLCERCGQHHTTFADERIHHRYHEESKTGEEELCGGLCGPLGNEHSGTHLTERIKHVGSHIISE